MPPRSKGRQHFLNIVPPNKDTKSNKFREQWIDKICSEFVTPSKANKSYYRVVLKILWPQGHGIPGPHILGDTFRSAIDEFRKTTHKGNKPYKPYVDAFRRIRELQGEEGITGIGRKGNTYQLVSLEISEKRKPRVKLTDTDWQTVLEKYGHKCAICKRSQNDLRLDQDHKIPRVRNGNSNLDNWMPLCKECNNFKSTACRGCELSCTECPWAFPEKYAPIRLGNSQILRIRRLAIQKQLSPENFIEEMIKKAESSE